MPATRYRMALAVTLQEMPDIANALSADFPTLANAIQKQWLEVLNSGVNVFGAFEQGPSELMAGLVACEIELITGIHD